MKTLLKTIKTLLSAHDKQRIKISKKNELSLLEKWWFNDEILNSISAKEMFHS